MEHQSLVLWSSEYQITRIPKLVLLSTEYQIKHLVLWYSRIWFWYSRKVQSTKYLVLLPAEYGVPKFGTLGPRGIYHPWFALPMTFSSAGPPVGARVGRVGQGLPFTYAD